MYRPLIYAIMMCMKLVSFLEGFSESTVNGHAHALNLNNQYHSLLYLCKDAAWTITLRTVLVICTTRFRVVQLIYTPLQVFKQP